MYDSNDKAPNFYPIQDDCILYLVYDPQPLVNINPLILRADLGWIEKNKIHESLQWYPNDNQSSQTEN